MGPAIFYTFYIITGILMFFDGLVAGVRIGNKKMMPNGLLLLSVFMLAIFSFIGYSATMSLLTPYFVFFIVGIAGFLGGCGLMIIHMDDDRPRG